MQVWARWPRTLRPLRWVGCWWRWIMPCRNFLQHCEGRARITIYWIDERFAWLESLRRRPQSKIPLMWAASAALWVSQSWSSRLVLTRADWGYQWGLVTPAYHTGKVFQVPQNWQSEGFWWLNRWSWVGSGNVVVCYACLSTLRGTDLCGEDSAETQVIVW